MSTRSIIIKSLAAALAALPATGALAATLANVKAVNPLDLERRDARVSVTIADIPKVGRARKPELVFTHNGEKLPSQLIDLDNDGRFDQLLTVLDFGPGETIELEIVEGAAPASEARTQAEISIREGGRFEGEHYVGGSAFKNVKSLIVPKEHAIHDDYIRYEGPGWESDKVAYRFYLDERNAFDIFGKRKPDLALQRVGQDGEPSYHEDAPWGLDILKVGEAVGSGGFGWWDGSKIIGVADTKRLRAAIPENGPLRASVATYYDGWKVDGKTVDLSSLLSIHAGSRLTHVRLEMKKPLDNLAAGIVKHPGVQILKSHPGKDGWSYLATYGNQTIEGDLLGMAVFFPNSAYVAFGEDEWNYAVVLKPKGRIVEYAFAAAWEGETNGIKNQQQFEEYLKETALRLSNPIAVTVTAANQK